jgi:PIN domain nuclease of toxin-antitoxin system
MAKFLIDTHVVLWLINSPNKISEKALAILANEENELFLSYTSVWEMSIKIGLKKLELGMELRSFLVEMKKRNEITLLPVSIESILRIKDLPHIHKDPFDRIIACQSITENIPLISSDKIFDEYNLKRIW